jgi:hypothetical protein
MENSFIDSWSEITLYFRENCNSLGSRLHKGSDGLFYAYAQWNSAEDRTKAFLNEDLTKASTVMKDCIEESFPEVFLDKIADYLI